MPYFLRGNQEMGAWGLLTVCGKSVVSIPDLHRILGKTGTNQQSNTNDINITDTVTVNSIISNGDQIDRS